MSPTPIPAETEIGTSLNRLAADPAVQSNCMFQLALMLARIATEPCAESYKEETAQAMLALMRAKPKSNVIRLFGLSMVDGEKKQPLPSADRSGATRDRPWRSIRHV